MDVVFLFAMVIGFMLIGVPIAISLGLSSIIFLMVYSDSSLGSIAQTLFNAFAGHYTLLAIPFFILASTFMSTGGVARRIIRFAIACVGHFQGGLAIAGVICNAGTLGILIPPSIVMVVYASAVDVSVGRMFLAGIIPGILAGLMLMVGIYVAARLRNLPAQDWSGWREILISARDAGWGIFLIVIILGGIYGGIFTPTEAAAVSAVYAFFIANFIYKDMGPLKGEGDQRHSFLSKPQSLITVFVHPDTKHCLFEAGKTTIMLLFIIANALILKHVLTDEQIPQAIAGAMLEAGFGPIVFLLIVNVILLIGGQFMEPSGLIVIVAPLVFPIAISLGIDPIHLGVIMVVNMEIGMITPPVGLNLFVTSGVAGMPMVQVVRAAAPWLGILFIFLIMITYIPWLSTVVPTALMGPEIITR
ncbi:MAG TPA: TRAP transporter large permease subunit [Halothiobacillaceae bacterium]|nr:TRAP transporter large permease subunit [Halothiobacillaceae bacterium]